MVQQVLKALSSKDAKKLYTNATAAVLRAKRMCYGYSKQQFRKMQKIFMKKPKQINEDRAAAEEEMEAYAEADDDEEATGRSFRRCF